MGSEASELADWDSDYLPTSTLLVGLPSRADIVELIRRLEVLWKGSRSLSSSSLLLSRLSAHKN